MRLRPTLGEDDEVMKNITRSWVILTFSAYWNGEWYDGKNGPDGSNGIWASMLNRRVGYSMKGEFTNI